MREKPGAPPQTSDETRINEQIRVREVRLIDEAGQQVGVVSRDMALQRAMDAGLDLVEVAPDARPPVCKVMDYAKFKYQKAIRERLARKKQVRIDIKEIKFRPGTDDHDFDVKMRSVKKFLEEGDKVKCTLRFRGREMTHQELGLNLLDKVEAGIGDLGKVEQEPKLLGKQMVMVIAPVSRKKPPEGGKSRGDEHEQPNLREMDLEDEVDDEDYEDEDDED
ncbi:MAG: translation initiation factor IF-3 [Magnetococcales bacterium]|nr:translation initiation factor IF-3 [Magnetococcales bacterium]NGZ27133.1 translation initiation factor IF-3 [Magnetococcales bacterium]